MKFVLAVACILFTIVNSQCTGMPGQDGHTMCSTTSQCASCEVCDHQLMICTSCTSLSTYTTTADCSGFTDTDGVAQADCPTVCFNAAGEVQCSSVGTVSLFFLALVMMVSMF